VAHPQQPSPFPPGHNDKYFVNKERQTQWTTETGPQFVAADTAEQKKKKRWRWIVVAVGVFALIVVAAVVGGVLGSRAAHKNDNAQRCVLLSHVSS
jgi:cytochrome c-type biogenesis protein CcmH/NrfG